MNEGRMMKVRSSTTLNDETDKLIGNPSAWSEFKGISIHCKEIKKEGQSVKTYSEKLTNINPSWSQINWKKVEIYVNHLQIRITKAVIKKNWNLVKRLSYLLPIPSTQNC